MVEYLQFLFPYLVRFKYLAVYSSLLIAGLGVPLPEEVTLVLSGYLVSIEHMNLVFTLFVCYLGVLSGDICTYVLGRYGGRWVLGTRLSRWIISRRRLSQAQYYYRQYGPRSLLLARQMPGIRFPTFFAAGMLKMDFWWFLIFDGFAALVSMPVVFFVSYYFGHRIRSALSVVTHIGDITTIVISSMFIIVLGGYLVSKTWLHSEGETGGEQS